MIRILHISDTHAEQHTVPTIEQIALKQVRCDVIALTGDVTSSFNTKLRKEWNNWPHKYKFLVPGNHGDTKETYENSTNWKRNTPWIESVEDMLFIGLDSIKKHHTFDFPENSFDNKRINGVVTLIHRPEKIKLESWIKSISTRIRNDTKYLLLHGHTHDNEWEETYVAGFSVKRSNVHSRESYGTAALITWNGLEFSHKEVRGSENS